MPDYLLAARQGIFRINRRGAERLTKGNFFGIAYRDGFVHAFVDTDFSIQDFTRLDGQVLRFSYRDGVLGPPEVAIDGLHKLVHQLAFAGDSLFVVDTGRQSVLEYDGAFRLAARHQVAPPNAPKEPGDAYPNSILATSDGFLVMFHNHWRGVASEIVAFDRQFRERERIALLDQNCHDIAQLADGRLLYCVSPQGSVAPTGGPAIKIDINMTRGLAVGAQEIVVGSSMFGHRIGRNFLPGYVAFLGLDFRIEKRLYVPAAPTQICAIDDPKR